MMPNGYSLIRKVYLLSNYADSLEMENASFVDLKTYQQLAQQLGIEIGINAETLFDDVSIAQGSGYLIRGKQLNISVPDEFSHYFTSNTLIQFFR